MRSFSPSDYIRFGIIALIGLIMAMANPASAKLNRISASLTPEQTRPAPGDTLQLAIRMTPAPGWHGYWQNPGDSGMPPKVAWTLPGDLTASPLLHPVPTAKTMAGFKSYVFDGPFALLTSIKLPSTLAPGTVIPIEGELSWLACSVDLCVPESTTIRTQIEINSGRETTVRDSAFQSYRAALPSPFSPEGSFTRDGDQITIKLKTPPAINSSAIRFFPMSSQVSQPTSVTQSGDTTKFQVTSRSVGAKLLRAVIDTGPGTKAYLITAKAAPVASAAEEIAPPSSPGFEEQQSDPQTSATVRNTPAEETLANDEAQRADVVDPLSVPSPDTLSSPVLAQAAQTGWLAAFLGAILGGLLLNLMPCVFPILSLKALSLARSAASEDVARHEALAYSAGAIISTAGLGALLIGLRQLGAEIGWAFQLQNPYVVLLLIGLMTAIGANLLGLFEIRGLGLAGRLTGGAPTSSAFGTGCLAAFVATPCSGPFMGVALGAALFMSPWAALSVFAGLGLGIALPFLAIGFLPPLRRILPRPGNWMVTLRRLLAIPMFVTAAALIWVLSRQVGPGGLTMGLSIASVVAIGLAWLGIRQQSFASGLRPLVSTALVAAIVFLNLPAPIARASGADYQEDNVQAFSSERLAKLRRSGTPVFVDFTADWCLTCKVNETMAISDPAVQKAFEQAGVVTLVGDWTNGDPAITEFLAEHGRNSIPYYLVYLPGERPRELPQILTTDILISAVGPDR